MLTTYVGVINIATAAVITTVMALAPMPSWALFVLCGAVLGICLSGSITSRQRAK